MDEYDWEGDSKWQQKMENVYIPPGVDREKATRKMKLKYYVKNVDPSFAPDAGTSQSSAERESPQSRPQEQPQPTHSNVPPPKRTAKQRLMVLLAWLELFGHMAIVVLTIFVSLPFLLPADTAFGTLMKTSAVLQLVALLRTHGFNKAFWQPVVLNEDLFFLFSAFLMLMPKPGMLYSVPVACRSLCFIIKALSQIVPAYAPVALQSVLQPRVEALLPKVYNIYQFGAEMEVYGAIYTLFTLFSSTHRNVVFTLALWQFMRLDTLILHGTWAPSFLRSSYSAFCIWAYSMVDPAQQQQQSRCTIM